MWKYCWALLRFLKTYLLTFLYHIVTINEREQSLYCQCQSDNQFYEYLNKFPKLVSILSNSEITRLYKIVALDYSLLK